MENNINTGERIELLHMDDPYSNLKPGEQGTVKFVDDSGTIHVKWDSGSTLGIIPGVDEYKILNEDENKYRPFPKGEDRNKEIGDSNAQLYKQGEEAMMSEDGESDDTSTDTDVAEEEIDPYEDKERRFRVSFYVDVHVPMTGNLEHDRGVAEQEASLVLKKLKQDSVSNAYLGGVAHHPFGELGDPKEFDRL